MWITPLIQFLCEMRVILGVPYLERLFVVLFPKLSN